MRCNRRKERFVCFVIGIWLMFMLNSTQTNIKTCLLLGERRGIEQKGNAIRFHQGGTRREFQEGALDTGEECQARTRMPSREKWILQSSRIYSNVIQKDFTPVLQAYLNRRISNAATFNSRTTSYNPTQFPL